MLLAQLGLQVLHAGGNLIHAALERSSGGVDERQTVGHVVESTLRGHGLDAADVGARRGLGNDLEQADLGGVGSVRATAELTGERLVPGAHGDNADDVAILLAKQGDSTGGLGLVNAHDAGHDRLGGKDLLVDQVLDSLELLGGQGLEVREVKAQVLGRHQRASLGDMLAQDLLKRGVEQVRCSIASNLVISYINQDTSHLSGTLKEFAKKQEIDEPMLLSMLRSLDLDREQFVKNMEEFSEGQKKKVLIAASLLTPAHLYLWDEPLNYIDVFSRMQIEKLIAQFQPTMLIVEHDARFARKLATKVVEL